MLPVDGSVRPPVCLTVSLSVQERRPFLASECTELPKAEKWRRQVSTLRCDWLASWSAASSGALWVKKLSGCLLVVPDHQRGLQEGGSDPEWSVLQRDLS